MRNLLIIAAIVVAVWFFFFRGASQKEEAAIAPLPPASPAQQFATLLASSPVDAAPLAALCSAYPQLGAQLLHGRQIQIKGTVAEVRTSGIDGRRAVVILNGSAPRRVVLICDLDQYSGPGVNFRYVGKFEAVGTELLYLVKRKNVLTKKVVITQGASISQYSSLKSMGASFIEFQMVNGPAWAKAETNE